MNQLQILTDRHHADLAWSLILLANRLNAKIFFPYGLEWYDKGYFKMYGDLRRRDPYKFLAKQYLIDTIFDYDGQTGNPREITRRMKAKVNQNPYVPVFFMGILDTCKRLTITITGTATIAISCG